MEKIRDEDPVLAYKPDPGLYTSNEGRSLKVYFRNILDNLKTILWFSYFWQQTYHKCPRFRKFARIRGSMA